MLRVRSFVARPWYMSTLRTGCFIMASCEYTQTREERTKLVVISHKNGKDKRQEALTILHIDAKA